MTNAKRQMITRDQQRTNYKIRFLVPINGPIAFLEPKSETELRTCSLHLRFCLLILPIIFHYSTLR